MLIFKHDVQLKVERLKVKRVAEDQKQVIDEIPSLVVSLFIIIILRDILPDASSALNAFPWWWTIDVAYICYFLQVEIEVKLQQNLSQIKV